MDRIRVFMDGMWVIVGHESPLLEEGYDTQIYTDLTCDFCKRPYREWVSDDPGNESPLDICDKEDCETVAMLLPINQNIFDM